MDEPKELQDMTGIEEHDTLFKEAAALHDQARTIGDVVLYEEGSEMAMRAMQSLVMRNCRKYWHLYYPDEPVPDDPEELYVRYMDAARQADEQDKVDRELGRIEKRLTEEEE